jgi:hypothetical protein
VSIFLAKLSIDSPSTTVGTLGSTPSNIRSHQIKASRSFQQRGKCLVLPLLFQLHVTVLLLLMRLRALTAHPARPREASSAFLFVHLLILLSKLSQAPPTQIFTSSIPKGGAEGTWTYPCPQMFFNSLQHEMQG